MLVASFFVQLLGADLADLLPAGDRQGAGPSRPDDARRAGHRPGRRCRCSRRCWAALRTYTSSPTPPAASTWRSAPSCSTTCWPCRSPISRRARPGRQVARVRELETIRNFLTGSALTVVLDLAFTVRLPGRDVLYSPLLTWIVLGLHPALCGAVGRWSPRSFRRRIDEKFDRGAENQTFLVESDRRRRDAEGDGGRAADAAALGRPARRLCRGQLSRVANLGNSASQAAQLINKLGDRRRRCGSAPRLVHRRRHDRRPARRLQHAGRPRQSQPVLRLAQLWQEFQQVRISVARLGDILNAPPEPSLQSRPGGRCRRSAGAAAFDHVTFRYRLDGPRGPDRRVARGAARAR